MPEKNNYHFGEIDQCVRILEMIAPSYEKMWEAGVYRMRPEDIKRLGEYLSRIKLSHSRLRDTLKLFEQLIVLSNKANNEKNLH